MRVLIHCLLCPPPAQPAGVPEILKKSLHGGSVRGGEEVFIIGKNFLKGTKVLFQENIAGAVARLVSSVVVFVSVGFGWIRFFCM